MRPSVVGLVLSLLCTALSAIATAQAPPPTEEQPAQPAAEQAPAENPTPAEQPAQPAEAQPQPAQPAEQHPAEAQPAAQPAAQQPPTEHPTEPGTPPAAAATSPEDGEPIEEDTPEDLPDEGIDENAPVEGDDDGGADDAPEESGNVAHAGRMTRAQYLVALRRVLGVVEARTVARFQARIEAKQAESLARIATILVLLPLLGLFLFFMPFGLSRKHPGKMGVLFRSSAIAAALFMVTGYLFAAVLLVLRIVQTTASNQVNPQIAIIRGAFSSLTNNIDKLSRIGPRLLEPTMQQLADQPEEGNLALALLENAQRFRRDVDVFQNVASFFKWVSGLLGFLPNLLAVIAVALFAWTVRHVFIDIVRMPSEAASGSQGAVSGVAKGTVKRLGRELQVTFFQVLALFVITLLVGVLLNLTVAPAISSFLAEVIATFLYVQSVRGISRFMVYFALISTLVFLLLNVALSVVASTLFLGKTQKIFREKFHDGVPFKAHARFFKWGLIAVVWALVLPLIYVYIADRAIDAGVDQLVGRSPPWTTALVIVPAALLGGWLLVFWAARGLKAIKFIATYKRDTSQSPAPATLATESASP